ncbi:HK97-gp10 family putative phage morphogenesis protein [Listeria booriae]|uniref:HK97-gp10 family putative phage morphogenesis protein n=1 Tax=Listeria booriae TaxID=1552123 RepID=UPI001623D27D|nr:HK97-gp10 family putative phage morphogenesis protein [Listeria booriae]MBC2067024.1 hypothetical protein [Listeria booriae]
MVSGLEELQRNLVKLQLNNKKAAKKAVEKVADLVAKDLEKNTPSSGGKSYGWKAERKHHDNRGTKRPEHGSLKDSVEVSGFKSIGKGVVEKDIGFNKNEGWRFHFPEFGTTKQRAQSFAQKTINQNRSRALAIYKEELRKGNQL